MSPKHLIIATFVFLAIQPLSAKDQTPSGYAPLAELKEVQAKAMADKKLVVLVVQGENVECPNCVTSLENGEKAVGSGVAKVYARTKDISASSNPSFPAALQARAAKHFTSGAEVTFVVFNPEMTKIIAEANRDTLQDDAKATAAFKKEVQAAKKALK